MEKLSKILKICGGALVLVSILGFIASWFDYVLVISNQKMPLIDWPIASILFGMGLGLFAVGSFLQKKFSLKSKPIILDLNNLGFVEKVLQKTRNRNFIMGISFALFGFAIIALQFLPDNQGLGASGTITLSAFGSLCLVLAILMFYQYSKLRNVRDSETYRVIMTSPETITHFKTTIIQSKAGNSFQAMSVTLFVGKKSLTALAVSESERELLKQYVQKHNSKIVFE